MRCGDRSRSTAVVGNALGMVPNSGVAERILVCPWNPLGISVGGKGGWGSEREDINESQQRTFRPNCTPNEREVWILRVATDDFETTRQGQLPGMSHICGWRSYVPTGVRRT